MRRSPNGHALAVIDEHLRGLAPGLDLAPLLEPASAWGRDLPGIGTQI
jgi:hypothetical protein